jgi:SAM-dependent methyltransferase
MLPTEATAAREEVRDERPASHLPPPAKAQEFITSTRAVPLDCPVCGDADAEPVAVTEDFAHGVTRESLLALRCAECGCVYMSPGPAAVTRHTPISPQNGEPEAPGTSSALVARLRRRAAARRFATWTRGLEGSRVLEVLHQCDSPTPTSSLLDRDYDLIVWNNELQYTPTPAADLARIRSALRPGGKAIVVLNNLESPSFKVFGGRHWAGYDFPRQRAVYSIQALRRLAARAGLEIHSISTAPSPDCWVESLRRALADWRAPEWLVKRFLSVSVGSFAVFAVAERLFQWRGRGGLLIVSLFRPSDGSADRPTSAADDGLPR